MRLVDVVALGRPGADFTGTVQLIRGKQTLTYDFKREAAKRIRVLPKDIIELAK